MDGEQRAKRRTANVSGGAQRKTAKALERARAKRRTTIKALGRDTPRDSLAILAALRISRANYTFPKIQSCRTMGCGTIVVGGILCTSCSFPQAEAEVKVVHTQPREARPPAEPEFDGLRDLDRQRETHVSPVGVAIACLVVLISLAAAFTQNRGESQTEQVIVAD